MTHAATTTNQMINSANKQLDASSLLHTSLQLIAQQSFVEKVDLDCMERKLKHGLFNSLQETTLKLVPVMCPQHPTTHFARFSVPQTTARKDISSSERFKAVLICSWCAKKLKAGTGWGCRLSVGAETGGGSSACSCAGGGESGGGGW